MMLLKAPVMLALLIGTSACATSRPPFLFSRPATEPAPVQVPPAECQTEAPARPAFQTPSLPAGPVDQTDPLASRDPLTASAEMLIRSRDHYRARALQSEAIADAALSFIQADALADANLDDLYNRCAAEDRAEAAALESWAARVVDRDE